MALSLLQICIRALDQISSFNSPDYIIGNTDDTAKTLLAAAFKTGETLVRDYDWQQMSQTATLTTVAATSLYDLESDYERIAPDTFWNNSEARYIRFPATRRKWAAITNSAAYSSNTYDARLKGNQIQIYPVPTAGQTLNYEYLSNIYCQSSAGVDRADGWVDDTDLPLLPYDLFVYGVRYFFSDSKNLPGSLKAAAEFDAVISSRQNKNVPSERVNHAATVVAPRRGYRRLNLPEVIPS